MDEESDMRPWRLTIPAGLYADLQQHLFPGDGDEHGAVVPSWLPRTIAHRLKSRKVRMAARNIHRANCDARIEAVPRDFLDADVAARFTDCDFLFLAAPSVVTMNAIACAHAADDFLFHLTGLKYDDAEAGWFRWNSRRAVAGYDMPTRGSDCAECSGKEHSRFGMGDNGVLPTRSALWAASNSSISMSFTGMSRSARIGRAAGRAFRFPSIRLQA